MKTAFASLVVTLLSSVPLWGAAPNIVLIVADDQHYGDFGFMGNPRVHTPHLDRLAARSARFTHGYVPSSVCRPSLVSILTGRYPHEHGVYFNHPPPGFAALTRSPEITKLRYDRLRGQTDHLIQNTPTLPRALASAGYRCLQTGKFWEGHHTNAGFTQGMTTAEPSGGKYGDKQLANGQWVAHGNGDHGLAIGRQTMQPIADFLNEGTDQPFFIWYAPFLPHVPHDSPPEYDEIAAQRPGVKPHELPYYASIAQFDATVGTLMQLLDQHDRGGHTIFAFVSDNGWVPDRQLELKRSPGQWDHTDRSKRAPFDDGLRTPILIAWDGHVVPATHEAPVSSVDLMPTLLSAAGLAISPSSGVNLWPIATGEAVASADRPVYGELYPGDASRLDDPARDVAYRWIRKGDYKLIVPSVHGRARPWGGYLNDPALFRIADDPTESTNLIGQPELQAIVEDLTSELDRWWPG